MKQLILIIGLIAMTCACQPTTEKGMTLEERQEIASTIRLNFQELMRLGANNTLENAEIWMNFYVETNDGAWMNDPALWLNMLRLYPNKEAVREVWTPTENSRSGTNYKIEEDYVAVLSPESAVYVCKGTYSVTDKDGNTGEDFPFSGSYVYVLRDGEWKFLHMHQSWTN